MLKKVDSSQLLIKLLERLSTLLARRRGLPIVLGLVMLIIGFVIEIINIGMNNSVIEVLHVVLRNLGVLVALIGLLLSEPLGE